MERGVTTPKAAVGIRWTAMLAVVSLLSCSAMTGGEQEPTNRMNEDAEMVVVSKQALEGPATRGDWDAATAESEVHCGLDDVAHDDIGDSRQSRVPDEGWDRPREPGGQRCGDDFETLLFRLTNCEREARGLPPLRCDERLVWAGRAHSKDMNERDYFSHVTPEGKSAGQRLTDRGVDWRTSAENIAMAPTMALAHTGWMESRGHRENILRPNVDRVGIGIVKADRGYVMTALFIGS